MTNIINTQTKIVNLFGGPGIGKSTIAAGLFYELKQSPDYEVELVTEYAKDLVWGERTNMFTEQDYIFAKQNNKLRRVQGKVDCVITDSPIILGEFYIPDDFPGKEHFLAFIRAMFDSYDNINILLTRGSYEYNENGRNQNKDEALRIDALIKSFLETYTIPYEEVRTDEDTVETIINLPIFDQ